MKTLAPQSGHVSNSRGLRQALLENMMAPVIHEVIRGIQTDIQTGHPDGMRLGLDGLQDVASRSSSSSWPRVDIGSASAYNTAVKRRAAITTPKYGSSHGAGASPLVRDLAS